MASLQIKIQPFEVPAHIYVEVPGDAAAVAVAIEDLDEATLGELVEEFAAAVMAKVAK